MRSCSTLALWRRSHAHGIFRGEDGSAAAVRGMRDETVVGIGVGERHGAAHGVC